MQSEACSSKSLPRLRRTTVVEITDPLGDGGTSKCRLCVSQALEVEAAVIRYGQARHQKSMEWRLIAAANRNDGSQLLHIFVGGRQSGRCRWTFTG